MAAVHSPPSSGSPIRDALTGAYSRALFQERWPDELERARRYDTSLTLCILDLDYFKSINDSFGHHRGDLILKEFVHRINLNIRGSDIFFRYGGDEFLLLLPNTTREQGEDLCGRILKSINGIPFPGEPPVTLGTSIGVATFPLDGTEGETLFHIADLRCYEAKRRGRNRCIAVDSQEGLVSLKEPSRLIERDDSLAKVKSFLDLLPHFGKGTFIIRGQMGSGKTRFLSEIAHLARLRNYFLWPVANPKDFVHPNPDPEFEDFSTLFDSVPPAYSQAEQFITTRGKTGLIAIVDQLESLESLRLRWLEQLLSSDFRSASAVVWTCQPGSYLNLGSQLTHSVTVELAPLSKEGMLVYLRSVLHWDPPEDFLTWIFHQTSGFPKQLEQGIDMLIRQNILQTVSDNEWQLSPTYESIDLREWLTKTSSSPPNNLPVFYTSFHGRDEEIERLRNLLLDHRFITLTGSGGIGKSRLALQAAHYCLADFPDGGFFVPLSEIRDPQLLVSTISHTLGIPERQKQTISDSLFAYLRTKRMLLILDTFENIIPAAKIVTELISGIPHLYVLITSRQPLHVTGEQLYPVPPLPVPQSAASLSLEEMAKNPSVSLFLTRAHSVRMGFHLTPENQRAVAELCVRLDGIPLAIELAANRIAHYSPQEMLSLDIQSLLTRAPSDFPQRHQTLQSVVLWSINQLSSVEREVFTILGLFRGSFDRSAVAALFPPEMYKESDIQEALITLADHNLLEQHAEHDQTLRYRMLRPIREVALELLHQNAQHEFLQQRMCAHYQLLAENKQRGTPCLLQKDWLDAISREYDNMRTAMEFLLQADPPTCVPMILALCPYWELRNLWTDAGSFLDQILSKEGISILLLPDIYRWAGHFAYLHGKFDHADGLLRKGIEICQRNDSPESLSRLMQELGSVLFTKGERDTGKAYMEQALVLSQKAKDQTGIANAYCNLARIAFSNAEMTESTTLLLKSLAIFKEIGSKSDIAEVLRRLSQAEFFLGNFQAAEAHANESLDQARELGDLVGIGYSMHRLGEIARVSGDYAKTQTYLTESMNILEKAQDQESLSEVRMSLAEFLRSRRQYSEASEIYKRILNVAQLFGIKGSVCRSLIDLGEIHRHQGKLQEAKAFLQEAIAIAMESGFSSDRMWSYRGLGEIALAESDLARASEFFRKSLQTSKERTAVMAIVLNISGIMGALLQKGELHKAAVLEGTIGNLFEVNRHLISLDDGEVHDARVQKISELMSVTEWNSALAEGHALSLENAIDYAMAS